MHRIDSKYYYYFVFLYIVSTSVVVFFSINFFDQVRSFTNKSDSMNPLINTGSVVMVKKQNTYQVGDVISYYVQSDGKEEIITHRILREGGNVYVTKGDANQAIDREVVIPRLVIGKAILIIPYIGFFISFAKGRVGLWLIILLPAILIVSIEFYKIYFELKKQIWPLINKKKIVISIIRYIQRVMQDKKQTDTINK